MQIYSSDCWRGKSENSPQTRSELATPHTKGNGGELMLVGKKFINNVINNENIF